LFRRLLTCKQCGYSLIGEIQKGHVYYRCHTAGCPTASIREDIVEEAALERLLPLEFSEEEKSYVQTRVPQLKSDWENRREEEVNALALRIKSLEDRLGRLTDAFVDRLIEKEIFEQRKGAFLAERKDLEEKLAQLRDGSRSVPDRLQEFLELAGSAYLLYKSALP